MTNPAFIDRVARPDLAAERRERRLDAECVAVGHCASFFSVSASFSRFASRVWRICAPAPRLTSGFGAVDRFGLPVARLSHGPPFEEPQVPNYRTGSRGAELQPGVCLAIEPMFTLGSGDVHIERDGWTVSTRDGALAAHFEHTIAVMENGPEILTTIT